MKEVVFISMPVGDLQTLIIDCVQACLKHSPSVLSPKETGKAVLDIDEFCEYTGLAKQTVYKMTGKGLIPHAKRGKRLYFDQEQVNAWLLENSVRPLSAITAEADRYLSSKKRKGGRPC
jgi:excisionase family DNA binding protein